MNKVEQSLNYFKNGFNCSQALLATFATDFGLSEEMALKVATQFGGGANIWNDREIELGCTELITSV